MLQASKEGTAMPQTLIRKQRLERGKQEKGKLGEKKERR
jgi:hypothetical protein